MQNTLDQKILVVTPPAAIVDNAAVVTGSIDTKGYDYLDVYLVLGATDIAVATCKLQYSDTDSGYADVPNGSFATGTLPSGSAASLPSAAADNTVFAWHGQPKKRYYDVALTGGDGAAGAFFTVFAILSRAKESPNTTAKRGLAQELFV